MRAPLIALIALVLASAASAATVSGTVAGGQGYTVLALSAAGPSAAAKVAANGRFALRVPGKRSTLQLVRPGGSYFGPVVLRRAGKKAEMVLAPRGGNIGRIALRAGFGAAAAPRRAVSRDGAVRTGKGGAPLGAGKLGYVKIAKGKGRAVARAAQAGGGSQPQPGADPDGDGIPSAFDADDNGNGTLDGVDPQTALNSGDGLFTGVQATMERALNANAAGISRTLVDAFVRENTQLSFFFDSGYARGAAISAVDVDCGGLPYCAAAEVSGGGNAPGIAPGTPWASIDANRNGLPDLPRNSNFGGEGGGVWSMSIIPRATTAQMRTGDMYQVKFSTSAGEVNVPTALSLYFVSTPAVQSYDAGAGPVTVSYPASSSTPGSDGNPIRMTGDKLTLTFWRPQRAGIGDEPDYVDMGRLHYGIPMTTADGSREFGCPASDYSNLSPTLAPARASRDSRYSELFPFQDTAGDAAPNPGNVLRFTLDLGACLRAAGEQATGRIVRIPVQAVGESRRGGTDRTSLTIAVCLPGCTVPQQPGPQGNGPQGGGEQPGGGGEPDLAVDAVTGASSNGNCDITFTIANRGTAMAPPDVVGIALAGTAGTTFQAQSIPAGGQSVATATITGTTCANRAVTVTADEPGAIDEIQENNNMWSGTLG